MLSSWILVLIRVPYKSDTQYIPSIPKRTYDTANVLTVLITSFRTPPAEASAWPTPNEPPLFKSPANDALAPTPPPAVNRNYKCA